MNTSATITAHPLCWPHGRPRAARHEHGHFKASFVASRSELQSEIRLLGGADLIISTNRQLRRDGFPLASQRVLNDHGVAVYFSRKGKQFSFACDKYMDIEDNLRAIVLTVSALRGIARWGTGDMMEAAFTGFQALPGPNHSTAPGWRTVLGFTEADRPSLDAAEERYRRLARERHPDRGGSHELIIELNSARDQARRELQQQHGAQQ